MSSEQPIAKRVDVGPIVDIVYIKFIGPEFHKAEEELLLIHIQQSKSLKFVRG